MRYTRGLISFVVIAMVVGIGFSMLGTDQVRAQDMCEITIEKVANPADDTEFTFPVTGGQLGFILRDPSNPTAVINIVADQVTGNPATVREIVTPGWMLDNIECTIPTGGQCGPTPCLNITDIPNGLKFECFDRGEVTCTFFNSLVPREVPTLSQYGLIAMAGILGVIAFIMFRRRKATA